MLPALQHLAYNYSANKLTVNKSFGLDSPELNEILILTEYLGPPKNIDQIQNFSSRQFQSPVPAPAVIPQIPFANWWSSNPDAS